LDQSIVLLCVGVGNFDPNIVFTISLRPYYMHFH
jgi:hypothetical protein